MSPLACVSVVAEAVCASEGVSETIEGMHINAPKTNVRHRDTDNASFNILRLLIMQYAPTRSLLPDSLKCTARVDSRVTNLLGLCLLLSSEIRRPTFA